MKRVRWLTLVGALAVAVMATGLPSSANHNADVHTNNIVYEGTSVQTAATNSDIAFWGNRAYAANYNGVRIFDISNPTDIENPANIVGTISCPGPQNDISVWDNDGDPEADLLFLSVDSPRTDDTCASGATTAGNVGSWEGVRIFDINDEENPFLVASVPTDCGSHTHTIAGEDGTYVYIYVASYPLGGGAVTTGIPARDDVEVDGLTFDFPAGVRNDGTECLEPEPGEAKPNGVHDKISIIRVPLADPAAAADRSQNMAGTNWVYANVREHTLPLGGEVTHINIGGRYFDVTACHDINTFLEINRAAGACWKEGIIWDISDPWVPLYLRRVRNSDVDTLFHSATFSWDGKIVVFEDEAGGGGENRCKLENGEPDNQGAMYFYKLNGQLQGTFKIPRHINGAVCTAHNYNTVPTTDGRRIAVSAWYAGGMSVIDYTDPTKPKEIGHYRAHTPPNGEGDVINSNQWSTYWYNGHIFVNDISRGFEVYSFNDPRVESAIDLPRFNSQVQENLIGQNIPMCKGQEATMWGTSANDDLIGTAGRDVIAGLGGNDVIKGLGGNDLICGGAGKDRVNAGAGKDRIFGEAGNDNLNGGPGKDFCHGGPGKDKGRSCEQSKSIP